MGRVRPCVFACAAMVSALASTLKTYATTPVIRITPNDIALLTAKPVHDRALVLSCGDFLIDRPIVLSSSASLRGSGKCTRISMTPNMTPSPLIRYIDGAAPDLKSAIINEAPGDANIVLEDFVVDGKAASSNTHLVMFYGVSEVRVTNLTLLGSKSVSVQDGVAFLKSKSFNVRRSHCYDVANACFDQWDGDSNFVLEDNVVEGDGVTDYGILINGLSTSLGLSPSFDFEVRGNNVMHVTQDGIGVYGLCSEATERCGLVRDGSIVGNTVDGVSHFHCINVGDASNIRIIGNRVSNCQANGIRVASKSRHGLTERISIEGNTIIHSEDCVGKSNCIEIGNGTDVLREINIKGNKDLVSHEADSRLKPRR